MTWDLYTNKETLSTLTERHTHTHWEILSLVNHSKRVSRCSGLTCCVFLPSLGEQELPIKHPSSKIFDGPQPDPPRRATQTVPRSSTPPGSGSHSGSEDETFEEERTPSPPRAVGARGRGSGSRVFSGVEGDEEEEGSDSERPPSMPRPTGAASRGLGSEGDAGEEGSEEEEEEDDEDVFFSEEEDEEEGSEGFQRVEHPARVSSGPSEPRSDDDDYRSEGDYGDEGGFGGTDSEGGLSGESGGGSEGVSSEESGEGSEEDADEGLPGPEVVAYSSLEDDFDESRLKVLHYQTT